ncbi:MAG: YdcF family protein [Flavobacteriales bacterium]|nr:YdcF family protein [Flavobacteriales bacterium]MCB9190393.1 YdcF family protein [Flavobacteriales bacterium]
MNFSRVFRLFVYQLVVFAIIGIASCNSTRSAFEAAKPRMPFDAVIVPGVPFDTAWSDVMRARVLWSHYLYTEGLTKNVIYSGSAVYSPYIESRIMAEYAKELGIPEENIFTEERAEHSTENVFYSYYLAKDLGMENIALATDPFQTKMVKSFAKKKKLDIAYVPAMFDVIGINYGGTSVNIDPSAARVENFVPLPEREGFFKRFAGTMGKNLKYQPNEITQANMKYN